MAKRKVPNYKEAAKNLASDYIDHLGYKSQISRYDLELVADAITVSISERNRNVRFLETIEDFLCGCELLDENDADYCNELIEIARQAQKKRENERENN